MATVALREDVEREAREAAQAVSELTDEAVAAALETAAALVRERREEILAANAADYEAATERLDEGMLDRLRLDDARVDERFKVLKEVLPVLDNLERAIEHAEKSDDGGKGVIQGVQLVLRQFGQALERTDVVGFEAAGQPFDPNLHEAISQIETDEAPPGTVVKVLQRGYKAGSGRLLRPARVTSERRHYDGSPPGFIHSTQDRPVRHPARAVAWKEAVV